MIESTSRYLVPFVFGAMALGAFLFSGCSREKGDRVVADPPSVYMKDTRFRKDLDDGQKELEKLMKIRERISGEMKAMVDAVKAKMPSASDDAVKKELEKNLAWGVAGKKLSDVNDAIADRRKKTVELVRQRLAPRKVSK